jgi:hypothetical protein
VSSLFCMWVFSSWFPMASPFPSSFYFLFSCQLVCFIFVVVVTMSKIKTLLKFLCFCCIVEVFVASSLPRFLSYCDCWVFCYIVITIVSLKPYHLFSFGFLLRFLLLCWVFYCSLLLQNVGIVVVVIKMVIVSRVFVFFHHLFFLVFNQFLSYIIKFFATSFYSLTSCVCYGSHSNGCRPTQINFFFSQVFFF